MKDRKTNPALKVVHRNDRAQIKRVLASSGQALLPMLELLEGAQSSIDELMHETAVAVVEQLLVLSAQELAGAKQRGREGGAVLWHGAQRGVIAMAERQLRVQKPRLRCAGPGTRLIAELVPFQHGDLLEMTGELTQVPGASHFGPPSEAST